MMLIMRIQSFVAPANSRIQKFILSTRSFSRAQDTRRGTGTVSNNLSKLESIKQAGINQLQSSASLLSSSTMCKKRLMDDPSVRDVSIRQRRKAGQIEKILCKVLERLEHQGDETFCFEGESIEISFVEISPDLRYSRVYWSLPFTTLGMGDEELRRLTSMMQSRLDMRGAAMLQSRISAMVRNKYPPKIKFIPAEDAMLDQSDVFKRELHRLGIEE
uniref:Ribosome-binding factor A n=1 Tax=Leptocylindrus danicus TaxID=163516 RepID=A0A7S2LTN0_9STRA|mmetsp:Transcript_8962/g.13314  ORF Transcript_8962/g.13314 Transcript_8962/m.13314 type:complete len:217 (+) Transcript_8962:125-775(+)